MNSDFSLGVHALVYLNRRQETLSSEALAENICTNAARVRRVMARLRKADLVELRGWREAGGYFFHKRAEDVTLLMVADALDTCFVASNWHSGDPCMDCKIASGIAGVMDGVYGELDALCRQRLGNITVKDVDGKLFGEAQQDKEKEARHGGV